MAKYLLGLDLGQAAESSALCMLEETEPSTPKSGETHLKNFGCRYLKRWSPGTPYPTIVTEVGSLIERARLGKGELILGSTLVGRPVVELFRRAKLAVNIHAVVVAAGLGERSAARFYHVSKVNLISGIQVQLQQRRLKIAKAIPESLTLLKELENYRLKAPPLSDAGYDLREGQHDDLVLALALACWWGDRPKQQLWIL